MRAPTDKERKTIHAYINSISVDTGIGLFAYGKLKEGDSMKVGSIIDKISEIDLLQERMFDYGHGNPLDISESEAVDISTYLKEYVDILKNIDVNILDANIVN